MSDAKVRNASNTGWITLTTANTKIRNASNTGWISASASNFKVRNAGNTGWIAPIASGGSTITSMSVTSMVTHMDVTTNGNHQTLSDGTSYGLWLDCAPHPYKDGSGNIYILLGHSENYRFKIPNWNDPYSWVLEGSVMNSTREQLEGYYNNRNWIFGTWASGSTVWGVVHHEWYMYPKTVDGYAGFNTYGTNFARHAISWAKSTNGGANFAVSGVNSSSRLILIPEPSSYQPSAPHMNGWLHPTNIVQEGSYYYCMVDQRSLTGAGSSVNQGTSLIRTTNLDSPTGWEFWNGTTWEGVNHSSYQGNNSAQQPYRFWATNNIDIRASGAFTHMQNIRKHTPSGKWVIFGFSGYTSGLFVYATCDSLAAPSFSGLTAISNSNQSDFDTAGGKYISVFDPAAADQNFMNIGNTCTVLTTSGYAVIKKGTLTIT